MPTPDELEDDQNVDLVDDAADDQDGDDSEGDQDGDGQDDSGDDAADDQDGDDSEGGEPAPRASRRATRDTDDSDGDDDPKERTIAELQARLTQLEQAGSQPTAEERRRLEAEEREYINGLPPAEKAAYLQEKQMRGLALEVERLKHSQKDAVDKAVYEAKSATNPLYAKHAAEVERKLGETRRMGFDVPRERLLCVILGEQVLKGGASVKRQQEKGRQRVQEARGRNGSGRGDAGGQQRPNGKTLEQRLENQLI